MSVCAVVISLSDWEWDMVDAEAAASGMTREELLHELFADEAGRELCDMGEVSTAGDRQWKSH